MLPRPRALNELGTRQKRRRLSVVRRTRENVDNESGTNDRTSDSSGHNEQFPIEIDDLSSGRSSEEEDDMLLLRDMLRPVDLNENINLNEDIEENEVVVAVADIENKDNVQDVNVVAGNDDQGDNGGYNEGVNDAENIIERGRRLLKNSFLSVNMNHVQINAVLRVLRREEPFRHDFLPKDARTLMGTTNVVARNVIQALAGGSFIYIGLKSTILKKLSYLPPNSLPENIEIDISTDGRSVHRVGLKQFWPIQFRINNISDKRPLIAAVFLGESKPDNPRDFLQSLVDEVLEIHAEGGIMINDSRRLSLMIN